MSEKHTFFGQLRKNLVIGLSALHFNPARDHGEAVLHQKSNEHTISREAASIIDPGGPNETIIPDPHDRSRGEVIDLKKVEEQQKGFQELLSPPDRREEIPENVTLGEGERPRVNIPNNFAPKPDSSVQTLPPNDPRLN
jgi:hypothetical protein